MTPPRGKRHRDANQNIEVGGRPVCAVHLCNRCPSNLYVREKGCVAGHGAAAYSGVSALPSPQGIYRAMSPRGKRMLAKTLEHHHPVGATSILLLNKTQPPRTWPGE